MMRNVVLSLFLAALAGCSRSSVEPDHPQAQVELVSSMQFPVGL